jgi:pimeloyl-ACP methyl ester carboxylesterase
MRTRTVLIDAVGIKVAGHPVADFFSLSMEQVVTLAFHNPDRFRFDPSTLPPPAQAIAAGNRAALATYAGSAMRDPTLLERLPTLDMPTLVLWGDSDGIADPGVWTRLRACHPEGPLPVAQRHRAPASDGDT